MGHADPRQDQETLLISDAPEVRGPLVGRPTDELIPWGNLPRRGAENHHRQLTSADIVGEVLDVFSDGAAESTIMELFQQAGDRAAPRARSD